MAGENALRVATFRSVIEAGGTDAEAASAAANVTVNFNRKGEMGTQLSALYLFFNPNVQGTQVLLDTLLNSPHKAQAWAATGALAGLAFTLAAMARGGDDEDEKKWRTIPTHVRDRNLIIMAGDPPITIPVPFGYGAFWALGNVMSDMAHGVDDGKLGLRLAAGLFGHFSPVGNPLAGDELDFRNVVQLMPTAVRMPLENAMNRNSFGAPIHPETPSWNPGQPDSQAKWRSSTGNLYDRFSVGMNQLTGGNAYEAGFMDVSPETWKTVVRNLFGGAGQFVADSANLGLTVGQRAAPTLKEIPILRKFVREETIQDARSYFREQAQQVKVAVGAFNAAKKAKDGAGATDLVYEKAELIRLGTTLNHVNKLVQARRMAQQQILAGDDPLPQKRAQLKGLEAQEAAIYDAFDRIFTGATAQQRQRISGG